MISATFALRFSTLQFPWIIEMKASSWGLGRNGNHLIVWGQDYKVDGQKSPMGMFELF